jgi:hypothetical protein
MGKLYRVVFKFNRLNQAGRFLAGTGCVAIDIEYCRLVPFRFRKQTSATL